jgi:LDH2 family malate/lactate/ureidoglycolate dehydrogenase
MPDAVGLVDPDRLARVTCALFRAAGVPPEDAQLVAHSLVPADLWEHPSHGVDADMERMIADIRATPLAPTASPRSMRIDHASASSASRNRVATCWPSTA